MSSKKILLVDDDHDLLRGMAAALEASGYAVVSAQDGVSAMSAARQELPDLIVLDIGLPAGNGFQVMEWLTSLNHKIPVIVVSARETEPHQSLALEAGALAFFQKPVDRAEFMSALRRAMPGHSPQSGEAQSETPSVSPREVFLDDVVAEALAATRARATDAAVVCQLVIPPGLPPAWADPDRTRQVLIHLLDNAIKFTPPHGVLVVQARLDGDADFVRLSVADSGCGVAPDDRRIIFERRADEPHSADARRLGIGVGLSVCRELLALQGGRIWVEGEVGRGATFAFTLPVFSLRSLCASILTERHLKTGAMSLITVETWQEDGEPDETRAARLVEIGAVLERCVVRGQAVVLPRMFGPKSLEPYFIVASTDEIGAAAIERRIYKQMAEGIPHRHTKHVPTVSVTMVRWPPTLVEDDGDRAIAHVVSRLHELVTATVSILR